MPKLKGNVIRVSENIYKRIKAGVRDAQDKKATMDTVILEAFALYDQVQEEKKYYVVEGQLFDDVAEARGYAIKRAVEDKRSPDWPLIAAIIGKDSGV